jgi:hypothetical protein
MKYVSVNKVKLTASYGSDILTLIEELSFAEFMRDYKAPAKLILQDCWTITQDQFQILSMWLCRGTTIHIKAKEVNSCKTDTNWRVHEYHETISGAVISPRRIRTEWAYSFIDQIPQYYIDRKVRNTQQAYDLGQSLIAKAKKASKIPFDMLEEAYKRLMKACISSHIYAEAPNAKTYFEASAELSTDIDLADLNYASDEAYEASEALTDDELAFYARVFGIELPTYYYRVATKATAHGFAEMPYLTSNPYATFSFDSDSRRMYAGNLNSDGGIKVAPLTLQKDGLPKRINLEADRAKFAEQVKFFLSLPEQERIAFTADGYDYCFECHQFFSEIDGCSCGHRKPKTEEEQEIIKSAMLAYALSH